MQLLFELHEEASSLALSTMDGELAAYEAELADVVASDANYRLRTTDKRKREYLVPRLLLRHLLGEERVITYSAEGAPCVEGAYLSVSHSGKYAAVAVSRRHRVALDIERPTFRMERVMPKFLSAQEQLSLQGLTAEERIRVGTLYWSAKETLFKYLPAGEVDFQRELYLPPVELASEGCMVARQWHDATLPEELTVRYWTFEELFLTAIL